MFEINLRDFNRLPSDEYTGEPCIYKYKPHFQHNSKALLGMSMKTVEVVEKNREKSCDIAPLKGLSRQFSLAEVLFLVRG
jgi:hypothetical protein